LLKLLRPSPQNYFVVLAYRYTTILSAQLINFWAIVVVVIISFLLLRVRYHWCQIVGILVCCGGMGLLLASDHITGSNGGTALNQLKGDLFMLLGASCYGLDNVAEEFLVSKRPLYEVVGQIGFWGMMINGAQAGIFDRAGFRTATWDSTTAGYIVGFTLCLFIFCEYLCLVCLVDFYFTAPNTLLTYNTNDVVEDSLTPIMFRMSSAAFFNISLLTGNFWGVVIGIRVFGYHIHYLYPIAFVLIMVGRFGTA
jgi:solute carrier family 35, member F1/2